MRVKPIFGSSPGPENPTVPKASAKFYAKPDSLNQPALLRTKGADACMQACMLLACLRWRKLSCGDQHICFTRNVYCTPLFITNNALLLIFIYWAMWEYEQMRLVLGGFVCSCRFTPHAQTKHKTRTTLVQMATDL